MGKPSLICRIAVLAVLSPNLSLAVNNSLIHIDRKALVSRADLIYETPAKRSEEGMPLGNGCMGSLVWTTPSALRFQINRVDVHAIDSTTVSFPRADSDFGYSCGMVDIHVANTGEDVFTSDSFKQHLSLYDALMTVGGKGLTARLVASPLRDVLAVEIDDQREQPSAINIHLRMLRYKVDFVPGRNFKLSEDHANLYRTANHTALSNLDIHNRRIVLSQQFRELDHYDSSAVAIEVVGRSSKASYLNETTVEISTAAERGRFLVLISTASNDDPGQDTAEIALHELDEASSMAFDALYQETAAWWKSFWDRGFVYMGSNSGQAEFIERQYTYFLYLMGASSSGAYPPRFGGMLWYSNSDLSRWGSQYWFANTNAYYSNLMPANRIELMEPFFNLYCEMFASCALAASQQWGSKGIWIPETTFFNGPERLPNDIASELQDLMLVRKPFANRSEHFQWYVGSKNRHNSRWNFRADGDWEHGYYVFQPKSFRGQPSGIFGHTTHILGVAARVGNLAWQKYQFTNDKVWLREQGYPIIRGAAEFYRHFPNLQKGNDGIYHLNHTNSGESDWNSRDAKYEISVMHMIFPLAIKASEILDVDADLRPHWQEIKDHLVPNQPREDRKRPYGSFVYGGPGAIAPIGRESDLKSRFLGFTRLGSFIDSRGSGGAEIFRNRLRLREGPGAIDAEHIAGLSMGIHETMLDSSPASVTNEEPLQILKDWPKDWNAAFCLLARGGLIVSSAQIDGKIPLVEINSPFGGPCLLKNPWDSEIVTVYRDGNQAEELSGTILKLQTQADEVIVILPQGQTPSQIKVL